MQKRVLSRPVLRRRRLGRVIRRALALKTAAEAVGNIRHGCEMFGLTKGDYSLIDLIEHGLGATGPADVVISTWTAAGSDIDFARGLMTDGRVISLRFVVDYTFVTRHPEYCAALIERFGADAIRVTKTHAKFVVITNKTWSLCLRSSMNLNENKRLEFWELSDDRGMADYLLEVVDSLFVEGSGAEKLTSRAGAHERAFGGFFGNELGDRDLRRAGWTSQTTGKAIG